ncbi:MAG TPA: preprotein translocase subunit YajC [Clostridia bacterium]|nr:preprotein translocase subunit YajC [Clostridia bacterium]
MSAVRAHTTAAYAGGESHDSHGEQVGTRMTPGFAILFQQGGAAGSLSWLMIAVTFAVFYFLLIRPQQRRQKKWQEMLSQLKSGDRVTTSGGIVGTILSIKDGEGRDTGTIILRVPPDNLKLEVARSSIVSVRTEDAKS